MNRDAFQAIADPTRRDILHLISHNALNVNTIASNFNVSRTAIYKHIKILRECGLVEIKQKGRERFCKARLEKLKAISDYLDQYRKSWQTSAVNLEDYLKQL